MDRPDTAPDKSIAPDELDEYLVQLLNRPRFRKAPGLRQLLDYLVRKAQEGRAAEIKESTIATDVFGRSNEFDSRLDNIVRVQAHRLRKTLEAHYESEGATDRFHISIPKGGYVPTVQSREQPASDVSDDVAQSEAPHESAGEVTVPPEAPAATVPPRRQFGIAGGFLAGVAVTVAVMLAASLLPFGRSVGPGAQDLRKPPLGALWGSLLKPGANCIASFTNPVFLWTYTPRNRVFLTYHGPKSALIGAPIEIASGDPYVEPDLVKQGRSFYFSDNWTGTGEVLGVSRLASLFGEAGQPLKIVRSRALTYADVRDSNVVFMGSPWANDMQDKINPGKTPLVCLGAGKITNLEPRQGERATYEQEYESNTKALTGTYALISVLPGGTPGTKIISSAGLDTYGTAAGADVLTSVSGVSQLIERFDPVHRRRLPEYFQAVIRTDIIRGDPARWDLVLVRELDRSSLATATSAR